MNYRMTLKIVGRVIGIEAVLMLIPMCVALYFSESIKGFLVAIAAAVAFAVVSGIITRNCDKKIYSKDMYIF